MRKILGILVDVVIGIALVISLIFIISSINGTPNFLGFTLIKVQSGSMSASGINVGDIRLIHKTNNYNVGDIIAFKHGHYVYFHQIVGVAENGGFITQGSSNSVVDIGVVEICDILGKQVINADVSWLTSIYIKLVALGITYFLFMWYIILVFIGSYKEGKNNEKRT